MLRTELFRNDIEKGVSFCVFPQDENESKLSSVAEKRKLFTDLQENMSSTGILSFCVCVCVCVISVLYYTNSESILEQMRIAENVNSRGTESVDCGRWNDLQGKNTDCLTIIN